MVQGKQHAQATPDTPLTSLLESDSSDEETVRRLPVDDQGSQARCARVSIQGVPIYGIVDSGADITIIGGEMFKKVAIVARLKKRNLRPADRTPYSYDRKPFKLDGRMDLEISFGGKTMTTPVYIKMNAKDPLLLSEGVCRQLGIITYHPDVQVWRGGRKSGPHPIQVQVTKVPAVRVRLVGGLSVPPCQTAVAQVKVDGIREEHQPILIESCSTEDTGIYLEDALVTLSPEGCANVMIVNATGFTQRLKSGMELGQATGASVIDLKQDALGEDAHLPVEVKTVTEEDGLGSRSIRLEEILEKEAARLRPAEQGLLRDLLREYHDAFSLEPHERGETDLVQFKIETGDATPRKQPPRRMPFGARREVARQLKEMQDSGVIQPSSSPWSSPVVLVRKKDGTLRFCVDYRALNSVTKVDTFPLPRIDDLLDQLGGSTYFTTLDLASGYWQIKMDPASREKTAFITNQGLFEFKVMPFGLCNAPAVFQRLMQRVLMGLNPAEGPDFVSVYLDDVLVFSHTLEDHLQHLCAVIERLRGAGLKLKPSKCHFIQKEVEYLGHVISPDGLKPNPGRVSAVKEYSAPSNVKEVRQFLGIASYYRRFIPGFAKIAEPLHALTRKNETFLWTPSCQAAFQTLIQKLVEAPVLAYPNFQEPFVLETDASIKGLGAVLSQRQSDGRMHPVAYASRALSPSEKNYSISELETLAVVWAINHYHAYLYGHEVTVFTDHSAVKAILETPSPSGKHARWWTKVFGSGVTQVNIVYRSGKENSNADALSRNPQPLVSGTDEATTDVQVASVTTTPSTVDPNHTVQQLLHFDPALTGPQSMSTFGREQRKDGTLAEIIGFLTDGTLPSDDLKAKKIAGQSHVFSLVDDVLYYLDPRRGDQRRAVVPKQLRNQILEENHSGRMAGHFSGNRLYNTLCRHWWWEGMYADSLSYCKNCAECAIVGGSRRVPRPLLHPIPISRPFEIMGVDIMELPKTRRGNQ